MQILEIRTPQRVAFVPITSEVQSVVTKQGWQDGILTLYVPHTTAGITINENADPDVVRDIVYETNKLVPFEDGYHHLEGNSAAHIKSSVFGTSATLIVENGRLLIGTWQGIFFGEFDGPRHRKLFLKFIPTP